jgi:hypothetical protein
MDVNACWKIQAVLSKVKPSLAFKQPTHLHQAKIVVGITQSKFMDVRPLVDDNYEATGEPEK